MPISYTTEQTDFKFRDKQAVTRWINSAIIEEGFTAGEITIVFCSDYYLLEVNKRFLDHDYFTDIITFDYTEEGVLSGDLMISVDTVRANATLYRSGFHVELLRIIIHGIMHLVGYKDVEESDIAKMRERENYYLESAPKIADHGVNSTFGSKI